MKSTNPYLRNGSRIAVIGAGPAGTFFTLRCLSESCIKSLQLEITIFDGKEFLRTGPGGCNLCAGVLPASLLKSLSEMGIILPQEIIQSRIEGYFLHTARGSFRLKKPTTEGDIITVYRGNGPRGTRPEANISFDDYLLRHCRQLGAEIVPQMVKGVQIFPGKRNVITYGAENKTFDADLIVVACGINSQLLNNLKFAGFGYRAPKSFRAVQAEVPRVTTYNTDYIHTFYPGRGKIRFVAFTPKRKYFTVTMVGWQDLGYQDLVAYLKHPNVQEKVGFLAPDSPICHCHPRIPVSSAPNFVAPGLVVVGDAACSRYYKNGIESALITASMAMNAAMKGLDAKTLKRYYLIPAKKSIPKDNRYGRILFQFYDVIFYARLMTSVLARLLGDLQQSKTSKSLTRIMWSTYTGSEPYAQIFKRWFDLSLQFHLLFTTFRVIIRHLLTGKKTDSNTVQTDSITTVAVTKSSKDIPNLGPLTNGSRIAIVGGGPSGVGCALTLLNLAKERGIHLEVIIYEGKIFHSSTHYNQCVGVLSPPIVQLLEEELQIPFPHHLTQRIIEGYVLHGKKHSLRLPAEGDPTISLRRVNFDEYLLKKAHENGATIIHSRVTNLEIHQDGVRVYAESGNIKADVIVGAFGLDDGAAKVFERDTSYRQPRFLNSIVTKIHPGMSFMDSFGSDIHAFLPEIREIEFGAITPKRNHLTINIAGSHVNADHLDLFLELPEVKKMLPPDSQWNHEELTYFKGRFPIGIAKGFYSDRFVVVGDAAGMLRPFKGKGVNTGIITGSRAAQVMMDFGISHEAFQEYHRNCTDITDDLPYGKLLRFLTIRTAHWSLLDPILILGEQDEILRKILFDCVSAHDTLKNIFHNLSRHQLPLRIPLAILKSFFMNSGI